MLEHTAEPDIVDSELLPISTEESSTPHQTTDRFAHDTEEESVSLLKKHSVRRLF